MKLLLILTVFNHHSIMGITKHPKSIESQVRSQYVEAAVDGLADEVQRSLPAGNRAFDITGCLVDCALKKVLPSAIQCFSFPIGIPACFLEKFDASCLIPDCLCSVLTMLPAIFLQIFQIFGICPR